MLFDEVKTLNAYFQVRAVSYCVLGLCCCFVTADSLSFSDQIQTRGCPVWLHSDDDVVTEEVSAKFIPASSVWIM